jgi:hypothetical protein
MYDTKFECRYHRDDVFLDTDNISDDEKNMIRDILYKEDLLNIFLIESDDNFNVFSNIITELYEKIKHYEPLKYMMKKIASSVISEDEQFGLSILYSYDYMYITHKCVSEYLDTGVISEKNINMLNNILK